MSEIPEFHRAEGLAARNDADGEAIRLWLHGRAETTRTAYRGDAERFLATIGNPLRAATLGDLRASADGLGCLAPTTQARRLSAVKGLPSFGHRIGVLLVDIGATLRLPGPRTALPSACSRSRTCSA